VEIDSISSQRIDTLAWHHADREICNSSIEIISGQRQIVYAGPSAKSAASRYIPRSSGANRSIIQTAIEVHTISFAPSGAGKSVVAARRFGFPKTDVITTKATNAPKNRKESA
jgi:hypothetical protein